MNYVLKAPRSEEQALIDTALTRCLNSWPQLASLGDYGAGAACAACEDGCAGQGRLTEYFSGNITMSLKCGIVGLPNVGSPPSSMR